MRTAVCAILLLMITYQGDALRCNYCFGIGSRACRPTIQRTCPPSVNGCALVKLGNPFQSSFRQCMNMAVCRYYTFSPGASSVCCNTDLCN